MGALLWATLNIDNYATDFTLLRNGGEDAQELCNPIRFGARITTSAWEYAQVRNLLLRSKARSQVWPAGNNLIIVKCCAEQLRYRLNNAMQLAFIFKLQPEWR